MTRAVSCIDTSTKQPVDDAKCPGGRPSSELACNTAVCDFCANNVCLGRGSCLGDACECNKGYEGSHCETPTSCKSDVVDANLQCCDSGVLDFQGTCCPPDAALDFDGRCCSHSVDACGVCGGTGAFLDIQNKCCSVVDANGVCCPVCTVSIQVSYAFYTLPYPHACINPPYVF